MTHPNIERMRLIVGIDDRLAELQNALFDIHDRFGKNVVDTSTSVDIEELSADLSEITTVVTRVVLLLGPNTESEKSSGVAVRRGGRKARTWELDGERLTFNEIAHRHPEININTLRKRLSKIDSAYGAHAAVYGNPPPSTVSSESPTADAPRANAAVGAPP